jgi:hypothetical protein
VAGYSRSSWSAPVNAHAGKDDVFVAKLDRDGNLVWNTFMGSAKTDAAPGVVLDDSGTAYVAGYSSETWGSPVNAYAGFSDAFVAEIPDRALVADFGTSGLWEHRGSAWRQLTPSRPEHFIALGRDLIADFGTYGLYRYDGAAWTQLSPMDPDNAGNTMTAWDSGLAVDSGPQGIWNLDSDVDNTGCSMVVLEAAKP